MAMLPHTWHTRLVKVWISNATMSTTRSANAPYCQLIYISSNAYFHFFMQMLWISIHTILDLIELSFEFTGMHNMIHMYLHGIILWVMGNFNVNQNHRHAWHILVGLMSDKPTKDKPTTLKWSLKSRISDINHLISLYI